MKANIQVRRWAKLLAPVFVAMGLFGCGGGGGGGSANASVGAGQGGTSSSGGTISGTAATGAALANANITVLNSAGVAFHGQSGSDGTFNINVQGFGPYLLYVDTPSGRMYGYSDTIARANINQLTDAIVRAARPANQLASGSGYDLVSASSGTVLPALDALPGADGIVGTADDLVRIKSLENRKALACVTDPGDSGTAVQKQAYTDYMTNESSTMTAADFQACFAANGAAYMAAVYANYVDLTWARRSAEYASNMTSAKSSVISGLGIQRIKDLTSSTDAVDLSAIDPMKVEFVAGSGRGFDGLLDRMVVTNQCDLTNKCAASVSLYADVAKTTLASLPEITVDAVSTQTPAYCASGTELATPNPLGRYNGALPGYWAVEFSLEQKVSSPLGTSLVMKTTRCPATENVMHYNGGALSDMASYTRLPAIMDKTVMQASQPLTCADFPIGQAPAATFAYMNAASQLLPSPLGSMGVVQSCTETVNDKEGAAGSFGIKVVAANTSLRITYHQVPVTAPIQ